MPHHHKTSLYASAEFQSTFTFSSGVQLPVVFPGQNVPFPLAVVPPQKIRYSSSRNALLIPRGRYRVRWSLNPTDGAQVALQVNGISPLTENGFPYTQTVKVASVPIVKDHIVLAPNRWNVLTLVNIGSVLFGTGDLPNTRIGDTAVLTEVQVERLGKN